MKLIARSLLSLALAGLLPQAALAQQTLTFTNTDTDTGTPGAQNQSVTLVAGSAVSILPNGNVTAQCALTGSLCTGTGSGGNPVGAPTVVLTPSAFSSTPDGQGRYRAGTTFTLTPTIGNGEVCIRSVSATTPANTGWPATVTGTFAAQSLVLPTTNSTYQFTMRCFNASGAASQTYEVSTNNEGGNDPGPGCSGFTSNLPAGWTRSTLTQTNQVGQVEDPRVNWLPFPNSGGTGFVVTAANQYHSIAFNTPATTWTAPFFEFFWQEAQQQGSTPLDKVYVTISTCPGDFRIPPLDQTASALDPTHAAGCRSFRRVLPGFPRGLRDVINYQIGTNVADETTCYLAPGRTYYINFIRADATDGVIGEPANEQVCSVPGTTTCGVQMRYF